MATFDEELLVAAEILFQRPRGLKGPLPRARIRRSLSTAYYALFHFMLDDVARSIAGTGNDLSSRRRILMRTVKHAHLKIVMNKVRGRVVDDSVRAFFALGVAGAPPPPPPDFVRTMASAFVDAQVKRHQADYDLTARQSERDARLLVTRVRRAISDWRAATSRADRDFKHTLGLLILMQGKLRNDD